MDSIMSVPRIEASAFERAFNGHLQDLLMVVYLSNLTRSQLAFAERMSTLL